MKERDRQKPQADGLEAAAAASGARQAAKKRYTRPALIEYGSIAKLTQTGGLTVKDTGSMLQP